MLGTGTRDGNWEKIGRGLENTDQVSVEAGETE